MKKIITSMAVLLSYSTAWAQVPTYQWANEAAPKDPYSDNVYNNGIVVDATGNSYITGVVNGSALFGQAPDTIPFIGDVANSGGDIADIYTAKYDNTGKVVWVRQGKIKQHSAGYCIENLPHGIAMDVNNNIYVTNIFYDSITFGSTTLKTTSTQNFLNGFITKYDASSNLIWAKLAGTGEVNCRMINTDAAGNIYVNGYTTYASTIGNLTTPNGIIPFMAKYNSNGDVIWAKRTPGYVNSAKVKDGSVYLTGYTTSGATFGSDVITDPASSSNSIYYVAKMDTAGTFLWGKGSSSYVGQSTSNGTGIATDNAGNCYVGGNYSFTFKPGTTTLTTGNGSQQNSFIAKYDASGNFQWANAFCGTNGIASLIYDIASDANGQTVITGMADNAAAIGTHTVTAGNFIANFNSAGTNLGVAYPDGPTYAPSYQPLPGLALDNAGGIYLTGIFQNNVALGTSTISNSAYGYATFVAKISMLSTGIENYKANEFVLNVYPNPSFGDITIALKESKPATINVFNIMGEIIYSAETNSLQPTIQLNNVSNGLYFIEIEQGANKVISKIMMEK